MNCNYGCGGCGLGNNGILWIAVLIFFFCYCGGNTLGGCQENHVHPNCGGGCGGSCGCGCGG